MPSCGTSCGIERRLQLLDLILRIVLDHQLQRAQHAEHAGDLEVQILALAVLQERHVDRAVGLGDADALAEVAQRRGGEAAAAQAGEGRQARIVPARHQLALDELQELPLAHQRVGEVEAGELGLPRRVGERQGVDQPVVDVAVVLELQRAERVGDALDGVRERMGEVVHRVDATRRRRGGSGWRA